jgi:hypothetical protein
VKERQFTLSGAAEAHPEVEQWLLTRPGEVGALARTWFARVRDCGADVREVMHDGTATACVGDAAFAYVGAFTAHAAVGFFQGAWLPDPHRLLEGTGKAMRHVKLRPGEPIDERALQALIDNAYRDIRGRLPA